MIRNVSIASSVNGVVQNSSDDEKKSSVNVSTNPIVTSDYSSENVKANYLSFKGKADDGNDLAGAIQNSNGGLLRVRKQPKVDAFNQGAFENITSIPSANLIQLNYYDKEADNISRALGTDKNILLVHKEQFLPEILVQNFTKNLKEGRFNRTGLSNYNSNVYIFDPTKVAYKPSEETKGDYAIKLMRHLNGVAKNLPDKEHVVFIKNFDVMLNALGPNAKEINELFERKNYNELAPNVRFVGMVSENDMKPKTSDELMNGDKPKFSIKDLKYVRKVNVAGLTPKQTKSFLRLEDNYLGEAFNTYKNTRFKIDREAVDELVDGCAYKYNGTFPQKAYDILKLVASSSVIDKDNITDANGIVTKNITKETVKDFYKNHSDLIDYLKMDESVFSFAQNVNTKLSDVGGAREAKEALQKIVDYAKDPQGYIKENPLRKIPKGNILTGPPGTGKTLLARAVAGEAGVPFSSLAAPELLKKYLGEGEEQLREWFSKLRQAAKDSGKNVAIGFIDEIDAFARARSGSDSGEAKASLLNQFLTELDGINTKDSDVHIIMLAATNRDDILDPAMKRPGRFDSVITVPNPQTKDERLEVMEKHLKDVPFESPEAKSKILSEIATMTGGKSGAELANLVNITKEIVSNREGKQVVTFDDMYEAFMQTIMGKKSYTEMPLSERTTVVIHEAGHAILADMLGLSKLSLISNEARGNFGGVTLLEPVKGISNFSKVIKDMAISYAGGDSEGLFTEIGHGAGVSQDYKDLTRQAEHAIKVCGLGINTPQISFVNQDGSPNKYLEDLYKDSIKKDIEIYTKTAKAISEKGIKFHEDFLKDLYVPKFQAEIKAGKGGNVLAGDEFRKMRMDWINSVNKSEKYSELTAEIEKLITDACNSAEKTVKNTEKEAKHSNPKVWAIAAAGVSVLAGLTYANTARSYKNPNEKAMG